MCRTYQFQSIDVWVFPHIFHYISTLHPLGHYAKVGQFWRCTFDGQDIGMVNSLGNYDFPVVFLDGGHPSALNWFAVRPVSYLVERFDRNAITPTKRLDRENLVLMVLVGKFPNIKGCARCERPLVMYAELAGKYMGSRKDFIKAARPT